MAICAIVGSGFSFWLGVSSSAYCFIPAGLFALTAAALLWVALRPEVQISSSHLVVGRRTLAWTEIVSVDRTRWLTPLVVRISTLDGSRSLLVYPGDRATGEELLNSLQRMSRSAFIGGVPYERFWGETPVTKNLSQGPTAEAPQEALPEIVEELPPSLSRPRLLLPEDELEVEQMFQRLKAAGNLESHDESRGARD